MALIELPLWSIYFTDKLINRKSCSTLHKELRKTYDEAARSHMKCLVGLEPNEITKLPYEIQSIMIDNIRCMIKADTSLHVTSNPLLEPEYNLTPEMTLTIYLSAVFTHKVLLAYVISIHGKNDLKCSARMSTRELADVIASLPSPEKLQTYQPYVVDTPSKNPPPCVAKPEDGIKNDAVIDLNDRNAMCDSWTVVAFCLIALGLIALYFRSSVWV